MLFLFNQYKFIKILENYILLNTIFSRLVCSCLHIPSSKILPAGTSKTMLDLYFTPEFNSIIISKDILLYNSLISIFKLFNNVPS